MKILFNYLLPLCLLLSGGLSQLEGQVSKQITSYFSAESTSLSTKTDATTVQAYNHNENGKDSPIGIEKEEKDETETSRKSSVGNDSSVTYQTHNFSFSVQKRLTLSKYATYLPSYKSLYILFEVFRI
jgi:hypothetical protein